MVDNIICPVSYKKTDENVVKTVALIIVVFMVTGLLFKSYLIMFFISADFAIRAFTEGKYSPIRFIAKNNASFFNFNKIPIDAAPKKFAAGLGFLFSLAVGISLLTGSLILSYSFGIILLICALLEGIFSFCVGCYVYTLLIISIEKYNSKNFLKLRSKNEIQ